nr:hypothetical protein [Tanacetum cinerariifolium]
MSFLSDFKEFNGGYVTFGGGTNGGRITGKGTPKTERVNNLGKYFSTAVIIERIAQSTVKRPYQQRTSFTNKSFRQTVNTVRPRPVNTATSRPVNNVREVQITATIDGKDKPISEASIRRHLKLEDSNGISTFPNIEIFEQLDLMGVNDQYSRLSPINTPSGAPTTLQPQLLSPSKIPTRQETKIPQRSSPTYTHVADEAASTDPSMPHDSPLPIVNTLGSDEGGMTLNKLTVLCIKLSQKVDSFEADLKQTKQIYRASYTKLIMKGRRIIKEIDQDAKVTLVTPIQVSTQGEAQSQESQPKDQLGVFSDAKVLADATKVHTYTRRRRSISTASGGITTAKESVSTAGASMPVSIAGMVQEVSIPSPVATKDKGKAIMQESEQPKKIKKKVQIEMSLDEELALKLYEEEQAKFNAKKEEKFNAEQEELLASETYEDEANPSVTDFGVFSAAKVLAEVAKVYTYARRRRAISTANGGISTAEELVSTVGASMLVSTAAVKLQEQLDEEERQRIARVHEGANSFNVDEWEDIQATIEDGEELALRIQAEEREKYFKSKKARLLLKNLFRVTMKRVPNFTLMESDVDRRIPKIADENSKRAAKEEELEQESSMRQKTRESSEPREKEDDELTQEDLQQMMMMVPVEEVYVEALPVKYPIIDWEDNLIKLGDLIKERFSAIAPTDDKEKELWVELKRLFKPDTEDELWKLQRDMHDPLTWRL